MNWLSEQPLIVMPVSIGGKYHGYTCLVVCPANAAFFAYALANIQDFVSINDIDAGTTADGETFDLSGRRSTASQRGVQIRRTADGTVRKVIVK